MLQSTIKRINDPQNFEIVYIPQSFPDSVRKQSSEEPLLSKTTFFLIFRLLLFLPFQTTFLLDSILFILQLSFVREIEQEQKVFVFAPCLQQCEPILDVDFVCAFIIFVNQEHNWREMEVLVNEQQSQIKEIVYNFCPPWALASAVGKEVSLRGKVINNSQPNELTLLIDPQHNLQISVMVKPYKFKYLFSQEQLRPLLDQPQYLILRQDLFPTNPEFYERQVESESQKLQKMDIKVEETIEQPQKLIHSQFFKVDNYYEIRGKLLAQRTLQMSQFTDFGDDFDLELHNQMLKTAISQMENIFYSEHN